MALTLSEKVDTRRHCGYPAFGGDNSGMQSWRFFQAFGTLEYRLNNLAEPEETVLRQYLTQLNTLETDIFTARTNMDVKKAAVFEANPDEHRAREGLYASFRRKLCDFLGLPTGPALAGSSNSLRVVV